MTSSEYEFINLLRSIATGAALQFAAFAVGWAYAYHRTRSIALSSVVGLSLPNLIGFPLLLWANILFIENFLSMNPAIGITLALTPFLLFPGLVIGSIVFIWIVSKPLDEFRASSGSAKFYILAFVLLLLDIGVAGMGYLARPTPLE